MEENIRGERSKIIHKVNDYTPYVGDIIGLNKLSLKELHYTTNFKVGDKIIIEDSFELLVINVKWIYCYGWWKFWVWSKYSWMPKMRLPYHKIWLCKVIK